MRTICYVCIALLSACASNSGVAPMGQDTYMVSRQAATGFSGSADLKADTLREASEYCMSRKKTLEVINTIEAQPPFILGNYPKAEVQFKCVAPK